MVLAAIDGLMAVFMKVNIIWTRSKDKVSTIGLTEGSIAADGLTVSNTVSVSIICLTI